MASEDEWPALGGSPRVHQGVKPANVVVDTDWEIVRNTNEFGGNSVKNGTATPRLNLRGNPKVLIHASSSPDLRQLLDDDDLFGDPSADGDNDEDSFSVISSNAATPSVCTIESANGSSSVVLLSNGGQSAGTKVVGLSWKDKIVAAQSDATTHENESASGMTTILSSSPRARRRQPQRFVVTPTRRPMRRSARSMTDLPSLVEEVPAGGDGGGDDGILLDEEYYQRKEWGARGRVSGLRLRPDEAKRKEMTLHKKNRQRAASRGKA